MLTLVGIGVYFQNFVRPGLAEGGPKNDPKQEVDAGKPLVLEIQARMLVGVHEALLADKDEDEASKKRVLESLVTQANLLNRGAVDQRLRVIIVLGEIAGHDKAKEAIADLRTLIEKSGKELSKGEAERLETLGQLYDDYADGRPEAPTVSLEQRAMLPERYGWFGELALGNPESPREDSKRLRTSALEAAERTKNTLWVLLSVLGSGLAIGLITLVTLLVVYLRRRGSARPMRTRLGPPVPHHPVYVETFAVAGLMFAGLNYLGSQLPIRSVFESVFVHAGIMAMTLSALLWPVLRGVPWRQVRRDIGLTAGPQPFLEPTVGVLTYCMSLPFAVIGVSCVLFLMLLQALGLGLGGLPGAAAGGAGDPFVPDTPIAHPIIELLAYGSVKDLVAILVLAAVVAPIVEETLFRGVLYRHLRDATRWTGLFGLIVSALVVNTIFAIIHPQGLIAAPALAALACGFVIGREWRGTLIPSMLAHGINNALMVTVIYNLLH